jgi:acyl-CoA synthetase (NDP forming)
MLEKGGYAMFAGILGSVPTSRTFAASLREVLETAAKSSKETIMALTMSAPAEIVRSYEEKGFLVHEDGSALMNSLGALSYFQKSFDANASAALDLKQGPRIALTGEALSERASKAILAAAGVTFLTEALVSPDEDAGATAAVIGFPVAIKLSSPDIAHKTEIGGVALNVRDVEDARAATAAILARAKSKRPDARMEGVLISPMAPEGVEVIAGVSRDPVFGPVVVFGLGGIFVEVLKDVTFRVAPFDVDEACRMIREIRGYPILEGVRGAPASDVEALARMLSSLSRFAAANADAIESIDLNPLRVLARGNGIVALDALLVPAVRQA